MIYNNIYIIIMLSAGSIIKWKIFNLELTNREFRKKRLRFRVFNRYLWLKMLK